VVLGVGVGCVGVTLGVGLIGVVGGAGLPDDGPAVPVPGAAVGLTAAGATGSGGLAVWDTPRSVSTAWRCGRVNWPHFASTQSTAIVPDPIGTTTPGGMTAPGTGPIATANAANAVARLTCPSG
jgi:hypothetical protein